MSTAHDPSPPGQKEAGPVRKPALLGRALGRLHTDSARASPLALAEAQRIAESIVGAVQWRGAEGSCTCPGIARHTTANAASDCKAVCEPIATGNGTLAPGVYCHHDSCSAEKVAASFALRSALGKRSPSTAPRVRSRFIMPAGREPAAFDPAKLESIARKLDGADAAWFAARSQKRVDNRTPASFLHELYRPGESVVIFDVFKSQGQALWTHREPPFDAGELDNFRTGKSLGVWFLANPVSGEYADTGALNKDRTPHLSRRSWRTVTSWRYLVLESDKANPAHWLAALAQMPLPIAAIYSSGGKTSIHALLRLDTDSKAQWDSVADDLKPMLITLGADPGAISAVRLTRLPLCERLGKEDKHGNNIRFPKPRLQEPYYLNGDPDLAPIAALPVIAPGWSDWLPAGQDGFDGREGA